MYQTIETLVNENKLSFACNHNTHAKYCLENNKKQFLEEVNDYNELYPLHAEKKGIVLIREYCYDCGKRVSYLLEGETLVPTEAASCFEENEFTIDIPVPSGELMFDDWFEHATPLLEYLDKQTFDINNKKIRIDRMNDYASVGVGHFFVGGSSPHIYQKDDMFYIGNNEWDEEDNEIPLIPESEEIGRVYTELRWVSICDRMIYEQLAKEKFGEEKGKKVSDEAFDCADKTLQVEPGTYRIHYFTDISENRELYAVMKKINA